MRDWSLSMRTRVEVSCPESRTAPACPGLHAGREPLVNPISINTKEVRK